MHLPKNKKGESLKSDTDCYEMRIIGETGVVARKRDTEIKRERERDNIKRERKRVNRKRESGQRERNKNCGESIKVNTP